MRALKLLVVVMGVMIVVGTAVMIAVIIGRMSSHGGGAGSGRAFSAPPLQLPAGARIVEMTASADRLVLRLALRGGGEELQVIDLGTGTRLGTIELLAAP